MSLAARGLWIDMLCYMRQGQPVGHLTHRDGRPITPEQLARMVGESPKAVRILLLELENAGVPGKAENGGYTSRRMLRDEEVYLAYLASQGAAGERGASKRWGSRRVPHDSVKAKNGVAQPDPIEKTWGDHGSSSSSSSLVQVQDTSPPATEVVKPADTLKRLDLAFERFWAPYPKKTAKKTAKRAFAKLNPDAATEESMLRGLADQTSGIWREHIATGQFQFIPHASTWISGERWRDELPPPGASVRAITPQAGGQAVPDAAETRRRYREEME